MFHKNGVFLSHCLLEVWGVTIFFSIPAGSNQYKIDMGQCGNHSVGFILGSLGQSGPSLGLAFHIVFIVRAEAEETMLGQIFAFLIAYRWKVLEVSLCLIQKVSEKRWFVSCWSHGLCGTRVSICHLPRRHFS